MTVTSKVVVLVPGFMGSELWTSPKCYGWVPDLKIWLNYPQLGGGAWLYMALDASGLHGQSAIVGDLVPKGPVLSYYQVLIQHLQQSGFTVLAAEMDWRQDINLDAQRLVATIQAAAVDGPVNIACHSRGGLVVRAALILLDQLGKLELVAAVAGFGVPHQGTFAATAALAGWGSPLDSILDVVNAVRRQVAPAPIYFPLLEVFHTWPSLYQLQPAYWATWLAPGDGEALYSPAAWQFVNPPVSDAWLQGGQHWWQTLGPPPGSVNWLDVVGLGFATPQTLKDHVIPVTDDDLVYTTVGDSVVVAQSARLGIGPSINAPTQHSMLCMDQRIAPYVAEFFSGTLAGTVVITGEQLGMP
jgi:hypothetical protein